MAGFGLMPAGLGPFGLGTPAEAPEAIEPTNGSRYINPATRDYEVDAVTGQFSQMPPTRQRVLLALTTRRDTSGLPGFGLKMPARMGDTFEAEARAAVQLALRHMTELERSLRVNAIVVEKGALGRARLTVFYTDLLSGERDSVALNS